MVFQLPELPDTVSGITYGLIGITAAIVVVTRLSWRPNLDAFPTVGPNGFLLGSWWAGFKFMTNGVDIIQEGYEKYKSAPFKVADKYGWVVILSNHDHLEEIRKAPNDELSFLEATSDRLNTRYTLGDEVHDNQYHVGVVLLQLTRNIATLYPEIRDEIVTAFEEVLDLRAYEWKSVLAMNSIQDVVCRTSNRVFVGLPLCRNPDWIDLSIQSALNVVETGLAIGLFPKFVRPVVARFFTTVTQDTMRGLKYLGPIVEERLKHLKENENKWAEMPNDLLSWLMEEAEGPQLTAKSLMDRVRAVSFPAIGTTSASFTYVLLYLAANPQYIQPLREEVEAIVKNEGWSKAALGKMRRVDSFLKECQRVEGLGATSVSRKAMKDITFSDGTFIPKGTIISVATRCLHHDEKLYKNAHVFEPFRFADVQEEDGECGQNLFVSTSIEYQAFGHSKHACPGRFFAANVMKTMLAHIVTTYDVKLGDGATRPPSVRFGTSIVPDPHARVLFRRRVD